MVFKDPSRRKQSCARLVILLALVFTFLSFAKPGAAQLGGKPEKSNLTISYTQASGAFTPLWVAQEAGLFKKYGLDATLKILNSQVAHQALIAGEVDVISSARSSSMPGCKACRLNISADHCNSLFFNYGVPRRLIPSPI